MKSTLVYCIPREIKGFFLLLNLQRFTAVTRNGLHGGLAVKRAEGVSRIDRGAVQTQFHPRMPKTVTTWGRHKMHGLATANHAEVKEQKQIKIKQTKKVESRKGKKKTFETFKSFELSALWRGNILFFGQSLSIY